jgi:uroporphyrinogen-III synthase
MARVLITRSQHQASALAERLRALSHEPVLIPAIDIVPPTSFALLDAALAALRGFHWLIFTSANAVEAFAERVDMCPQGQTPKQLSDSGGTAKGVPYRPASPLSLIPSLCFIAAIGPATARAVEQWLGTSPKLVPPQAVAESLAKALLPYAKQPDGSPMRFLLVRAEQARDALPEALRAAGAEVAIVPAYRNVVPAGSVDALRALFVSPAAWPDAITFTSSSTAANLRTLLDEAGIALPEGVLRVSIGPITSQTMRDLGMPPHAEAAEATVEALADAVVQALRGK